MIILHFQFGRSQPGTWNINIGGATLSFNDPAYTFGPSSPKLFLSIIIGRTWP